MVKFQRVKNLIFSPDDEWQAIAIEEPVSVIRELLGYGLPLAILGPAAYGVAIGVFGLEIGPAQTPFPMDSPLGSAVGEHVIDPNLPIGENEIKVAGSTALRLAATTFFSSILSVTLLGALLYLVGLTMRRGLPARDAFRVAVYASTPAWLAAVGLIHALLFVVSVIGVLYSLYLCYLGTRAVMKISSDDAPMLMGMVVFCALLLSPLIGYLSAALGLRIG